MTRTALLTRRQLLGADQSADLEVPPAHKQRVQHAVARALVQVRIVGEIVYNDQNLVEGSQLHLLAGLRDLSLLANNLAQCRLVPLLEVGLFPVGGHLHGLLDVPLDGAPAVVHVDAGAENVDSFEAAPVLLQNHADERHRLARLAGPEQYACHRQFGDHGVPRLLARVLGRRKQLYLAHGLSLRAGGRGTCGTSFSP